MRFDSEEQRRQACPRRRVEDECERLSRELDQFRSLCKVAGKTHGGDFNYTFRAVDNLITELGDLRSALLQCDPEEMCENCRGEGDIDPLEGEGFEVVK